MKQNSIQISVVVPFYNGNQYMERLLNSIHCVAVSMREKASFEVIIVNDSPDVAVQMPVHNGYAFSVKIYCNDRNCGIQQTRVNGVKHAAGEWIIFLDQDDEILSDGFEQQLQLSEDSDVVVGNGLYEYGAESKSIYKNLKTMRYLIQKKRLIEIRNLIPSPGECMIRRDRIPEAWIQNPLSCNGADDWLLWLLLFQNGARFLCNDKMVYVHHNAGGQNLSLDLEKMYRSSMEMSVVLRDFLQPREYEKLQEAINFKFLQDTKQLTFRLVCKYYKAILRNVLYKLNVFFAAAS